MINKKKKTTTKPTYGMFFKLILFFSGFALGFMSDIVKDHLESIKEQETLATYIKAKVEREIKTSAGLNKKMHEIIKSSNTRIIDATIFKSLHRNDLNEKIGVNISLLDRDVVDKFGFYIDELEFCREFRNNFIKRLIGSGLNIDTAAIDFEHYSDAISRVVRSGEALIKAIEAHPHSCLLNFLH